MNNFILSSLLSVSLLFNQSEMLVSPVAGEAAQLVEKNTLASASLDLNKRALSENINDGFKENILLAVGYFKKINAGQLILQPGEVFAFHKNILPQFKGEKVITQESGFGVKDGYKVVAGLAGNGVCHLASLMNKVAQKAGLEVVAEVDHNFAPIPGIEQEYGTSIYFLPEGGRSSERQNLYIKNNKNYPIKFEFSQRGEGLSFAIIGLF